MLKLIIEEAEVSELRRQQHTVSSKEMALGTFAASRTTWEETRNASFEQV
jgi:hypothetical protein